MRRVKLGTVQTPWATMATVMECGMCTLLPPSCALCSSSMIIKKNKRHEMHKQRKSVLPTSSISCFPNLLQRYQGCFCVCESGAWQTRDSVNTALQNHLQILQWYLLPILQPFERFPERNLSMYES